MEELVKTIPINKLVAVARDYKEAARVVNLSYVTDEKPGIERQKKGKGFVYKMYGKPVKDKKQLARIRSLVIPPAWKDVWICENENGHIQATGIDARQRKQYIYHKVWGFLRNQTKFHQLYLFGKCLPALRKQLAKDLSGKEMDETRVLSIVVSLMDQTYIRVGNKSYEKLNGSYGITTLKDKNVKVNGGKIRFSFKGKKGIEHDITLKNKKLAKAVRQCREIPGKELFQYYDVNGEKKCIDSGMINRYIKEKSGYDFTAKDFRTWAGTLEAFKFLAESCDFETDSECKKLVVSALDEVSRKLGNTRSVCRKYYVHPGVIELFENKKLREECSAPTKRSKYFDEYECMLMRVLRKITTSKRR